MIAVDIELWPWGDESEKRTLARIVIWNDGSGTTEMGNYEWVVSHQATVLDKLPEVSDLVYGSAPVWKRGLLTGFARRKGAVKLLAAVLRKARL